MRWGGSAEEAHRKCARGSSLQPSWQTRIALTSPKTYSAHPFLTIQVGSVQKYCLSPVPTEPMYCSSSVDSRSLPVKVPCLLGTVHVGTPIWLAKVLKSLGLKDASPWNSAGAMMDAVVPCTAVVAYTAASDSGVT